jgi:hypothetical protein
MHHWSHRVFEIIEGQNYPCPSASSTLFPLVVFVWGAVLLGAAVIWLDAMPFQILGYVAYPLEYVINAVFFPNVVTRVHGNVTAFFTLAPAIAMVLLCVTVIRRLTRLGRSALQFVRGGR